MKSEPQIKKYTSPILFLQDVYLYRKRQDPHFSYATWSKELGLKNRGYLRLVVAGERPINQKLLDALCENAGFDDKETRYFINLVNYEQSKNREQKKVFAKSLLAEQVAAEEFSEVEQHYDFLSNSLLPRLLTLLAFDDLAADPVKMARALDISASELAAACQQLLRMNLIKKSESAPDVWQPVKRNWRLGNNFKDLAYREFYIGTLDQARKAIDQFEAAERRFRNLFVAMGPEQFESFLGDFETFIQEQSVKLGEGPFQEKRLYQLNFNFFPATSVTRGKVLESK